MSRLRFTDDFSFSGKNKDNPTILLLIDPQNDFHLEKERVKNSAETGIFIKDARKSAENIKDFIIKKIDDIDEIIVTLDSHHKKHIAHKSFWKSPDYPKNVIEEGTQLVHKEDEKGKKVEDGYLYEYKNGERTDTKWEPKDISLSSWVTTYTDKLKRGRNNFKLTIWPDHCLIGSKGYAIYPEIQGALQEWIRKHPEKSIKYVTKGMNCLTEMYSAIAAEVIIENDPTTAFNVSLVRALSKANTLYVCGQASSHVVKYTMEDLTKSLFKETYEKRVAKNISEDITDLSNEERNLQPKNIILLEDCMNHVEEFEKDANKFLENMRALECLTKKSTEIKKN